MGRSVFEAMGQPRERSEAMVTAFEEMDRKAMAAVAEVHDPAIPPHENPAYVARVLEVREEWEAELNETMAGIRDADADARGDAAT